MDLLGIIAVVLLALVNSGLAHSNVERLMRIAPNGTMIGTEGYPRGFVSRTNPQYSDPAVGWLVPPNGNSKILQPDTKVASPPQRTANYSTDLPMLVAAPGDMIALQYQENGHVTIPDVQPNKTNNRGTVFIYGTTDLSPEANILDILYKWTADGTGGDGKGQLLATRNFDDGQCYQVNTNEISIQRQAEFSKPAEEPMGQNLWCQSDVKLPSDLAVGKPYTILWIWDWPTLDRPGVAIPPSSAPDAGPGPGGEVVVIPEIYTTVMDVQIVDSCDSTLGEVKGPQCQDSGTAGGSKVQLAFAKGQDLNTAAVEEQLNNDFLVDVPSVTGNNTGGSSNASASIVATASPSASSTHCPGRHGGGNRNGVKTETVYATIQTVTVTTTVEVPGPTGVDAGGLAESTTTGEAPAVSPFMRNVRVRRGPGAFRFNRGE